MTDYSFLSSEQKEFIRLAVHGNNILVDACIGSGKTTSIQALCQYLNGKSVLYLTYNKLLKVEAKKKITFSNVQVTNYNGFAWWCLYKVGVKCGISDQFQTFNRVKPPIPKHYDVLIIDEYQDIEEEMTYMLEYIKACNPGLQIIAVGDMDQKIYDKTRLDVADFINRFLGEHHDMKFTKCFRLSREIAERFGIIWNKAIVGVNDDCKVSTMPIDKVTGYLASQNPKDILCLGARTGNMSKTLNELELRYPKKFNKSTVYASIADNDRGNVEPSDETAIFTTFDSSKGMERPICVIFDYDLEYWVSRSEKPNADKKILRNIFCVAGSRGKNHIIFATDKKKHEIPTKTLTDAAGITKKYHAPFEASTMRDFKYKEDIDECFRLLKIEPVERYDHSIIEIPNRDEMIDLSPCIGTYQEAKFFKNYNIEQAIKNALTIKDMFMPRYRSENPDLIEKVLMLTSIETSYNRYLTQTELDFISDEQTERLKDRLRTVFTGNEDVQLECSVSLRAGTQPLIINGIIDAIKDGVIYELKYVQELTHEHFLQLAFYLSAKDIEYGYIWNTRNNEMYKVYKPEDSIFYNKLVTTITKQAYTRCTVTAKNDQLKNMDRYKRHTKNNREKK